MSQYATELCLLLVDDIYGELTSRIFEALLCYGRLTLPAILRYTHLTARQVSNSLVILVQQHLALWHTSKEDNNTYYEADWINAYSLIRCGKHIRNTEVRFGDFEGGVISNLLLLGHARVEDLARAYGVPHMEEQADHVDEVHEFSNRHVRNGLEKPPAKCSKHSLESLQSALRLLLEAGHVCKVHESQLHSTADNRAEAEKAVQRMPQFQAPLKGKMKDEYAEAVERKLAAWRDVKFTEIQPMNGAGNGKKRYLDESESGNNAKRARLDGCIASRASVKSSNTDQPRTINLEDDLVLRVNHEKFAVIARNKRLVELAEETIGKDSSKVYETLLTLLESNIQCCSPSSTAWIDLDDDDDNELEDRQVSIEQLASCHDDYASLFKVIDQVEPSKVDLERFIHPKKRRRKISDDKAQVDDDASTNEENNKIDSDQDDTVSNVTYDIGLVNGNAHNCSKFQNGATEQQASLPDRQAKLNIIRDHLLLLAEHPYRFVERLQKTHTRTEKWAVNFSALSHQMRLIELENTILTRYGEGALRVVRILEEKGKLDEKAITNIGLINQKVIRAILTTMHKAGHLELQEIPRDNHRQPSRTMFFWFFDPERCRQKVLEETYKAMARCMQRVKVEREAVQVTIDKASRTDVVGKEDEYLGDEERNALEAWREKEEKLLGELNRLDDLVAVLRDF